MRTIRHTFSEIGSSWSKSGICPACGKPAKRSKKFCQTQNPFNRAADGSPKSIKQIHEENAARAKAWQAEPTYHAGCE